MRERDVADTSSWEPWQHDYPFGVVLVMPPPHVASPIDALRQAYDQKSHAICSAHISVSDPLRRQMSDDAQKEIQELLRTVEPFEVHYDRPTASARRPGVAYPVSPQERFDELKCIIHQASVFEGFPYSRHDIPDCKLLMALDCEVVSREGIEPTTRCAPGVRSLLNYAQSGLKHSPWRWSGSSRIGLDS